MVVVEPNHTGWRTIDGVETAVVPDVDTGEQCQEKSLTDCGSMSCKAKTTLPMPDFESLAISRVF